MEPVNPVDAGWLTLLAQQDEQPSSSFFSLPFSSSSARSRLASETSIPPNLAFQLYSVASDIPYFRQSSPAFAPASCSRNTAMICSSVNLLRFIGPSLVQAGL